MEHLLIRNETKKDYRDVENMTREAFWNLYVPGCCEHYVAHVLREHEDFIPELDFVMELDGQIIGNIMYTKASLTDENGTVKPILTFGPVCIRPGFQRRGFGKKLIEHSFEAAAKLHFDTVVIFGDPNNYVGLGFKSCKKYHVSLDSGRYPAAMLVKELNSGVLAGHQWIYTDSPAYHVDEALAEAFDSGFEPKEKKYETCQESFFICSNSFIE